MLHNFLSFGQTHLRITEKEHHHISVKPVPGGISNIIILRMFWSKIDLKAYRNLLYLEEK